MPPPAPIHRLQLRIANAWHQRAITLKAASFALVGVVNTVVDFSVFYFLVRKLFKLPYFIALFDRIADDCQCGAAGNIALIPANIVSWAVAVSGVDRRMNPNRASRLFFMDIRLVCRGAIRFGGWAHLPTR